MKNISIMKHIILSSLFLVCCNLSYGQIELELLDATSFQDADLTDGYLDLSIHVLVTNTSTETIDIKWEIVPSEDNCSSEWGYLGCDDNQCYLENIFSNVNPPGEGPNVPSVMTPNESYEFIFHLRPHNTSGCCDIELLFSAVENPDSILTSLMFPLAVNDTSCTTAVDDQFQENSIVFPNPFSDVLNIKNETPIKSISIIDMHGSQILVKNNSFSNQIDLNQLKTGLYLLKMIDVNGNNLKSVKIFKQ